MIRWFKTKRALIKELREYQTAFDALTDSFKRHRTSTQQQAATQRLIVTRLEQQIERMRASRGYGAPRPVSPMAARLLARPLPADLADAIDEETTAKRRLDGLGD